ncbi:MAG: sodium ion-translocating decarboxylase subunit beta, partial [Chloroflexi bacterium]|nr:sodium ion-translocating decarboxylase subunit beta [Chloroflexota bacterium]
MTDFEGIWEGFTAIGDDPRMVAMWLIAAGLLFVGIVKKKEPLLLIPIGTGILLANLPLGELIRSGEEAGRTGEAVGFIWVFQEYLLHTDILPLLVFLGLGALTDFEPMLSNPKTLLLGAGAQAGVFVALIGALLLGMTNVFDFGLL